MTSTSARIHAEFIPVTRQPQVLSQEQVDQFNEDGYFIVPSLLNDDEIKRLHDLHKRVEALAQERGESFENNGAYYDVEELAEAGTYGLRKIQEVFRSEKEFSDILTTEKVLDIVADLIGDDIYYHSSKLMCKPANGGRRKPWHQDWAYWTEMNTNQVTVWTAIDPATVENGCMQIIPGSHKRGYIEHTQQEDWMINESGIANENVVIAEMNPGDTLIFNVLALHASDPNNSPHNRLSTIIDFDSERAPEAASYGEQKKLR